MIEVISKVTNNRPSTQQLEFTFKLTYIRNPIVKLAIGISLLGVFSSAVSFVVKHKVVLVKIRAYYNIRRIFVVENVRMRILIWHVKFNLDFRLLVFYRYF